MSASAPELVLIAALDRHRAIGRGNTLPWHLPEDLKRFKALTLGGTLLMGRRSFESIGRPLPGRRTLVLSRSAWTPPPGVEVFPSFEAALAAFDGERLNVVGGGAVYALALPRATVMHLTHVDTEVEGADAWFPAFDPADWIAEPVAAHARDARHAHAFRFVDYRRRV